jgi:F-type H+-transporting ATPase subunit gamma
MLPLEVVEGVAEAGEGEALPLYDFEPSAPRSWTRCCRGTSEPHLLRAAAGGRVQARRQAARDEVGHGQRRGDSSRMYTRLANQARQAEITQEISEIVGRRRARLLSRRTTPAGSDDRRQA